MATSNRNIVINCCLVASGMLALAYASVPLYRLFCEATGYGGTTRQALSAPTQAAGRAITVTFNADLDPNLPWRFKPAEPAIATRIGEQTLTQFTAENLTKERITGHATYNVIPFAAGPYFNKIECFCFKEQTLEPGQKVSMPVLFFIDPAIKDDPDMKNVKTITLSYTFFPVKNEQSQTPGTKNYYAKK